MRERLQKIEPGLFDMLILDEAQGELNPHLAFFFCRHRRTPEIERAPSIDLLQTTARVAEPRSSVWPSIETRCLHRATEGLRPRVPDRAAEDTMVSSLMDGIDGNPGLLYQRLMDPDYWTL